ncbi:hypothetical protein CW731_13570 [Polaribacter sp. ALD11]|nr:hypothetical protein CW731_13570 [Polaribacter sp. ALD11]
MDAAAQEKNWFDANGNSSTKEKAVYYRISFNNKIENKLIVDYYISGEKAKEFFFVEGSKDGKFIEFYVTGEVKTTGKFEDGYRDGMWKTYDKNGNIKEKGKYDKGKKVGVWKNFYKNN